MAVSVSAWSCGFGVLSLLLLPAVSAHENKVTPIQTVIQLLESLTAKVTEDGKKEAATYDKFACFCKEQADNKLYAITNSNNSINEMTATIEDLTGKTTNLATLIGKDETSITSDKKAKKSEIASRAAEHDRFLEDKANLENGIAAVENAIEVLGKAKGELVDAKLTGLVQKVRPVLAKFAPGQLSLLAQLGGQPGESEKYQYQGNKLLSILAGVLDTFKGYLKEMETTEFEAKAASDEKVLGLTNQIAFTTKDKNEKEATHAALSEELASTQGEKDAEAAAMKADQDFWAVVQLECEKKAEQWDKRSLMRADELKALNEATEELKTGALENFNANKKLVDLQQASKKSIRRSVSFLQLHRARMHSQVSNIAVKKVEAFLATAANRLSSSALSSAAVKILLAKDHFVKVRALIKDLVTKLEADARAEATQKESCDTGMATNIEARDTASAKIEAATAAIDRLDSDNAKLKSEIATLRAEISESTKALADKTTLRTEESNDNEVTESMSEEGKAAVAQAIQILSEFYEGAKGTVLVQKGKYVPPNADRSGNTIRDYQDEIFTDTYKGAQTESHGIIGILQTILSDFDRTYDTTKENERTAEGEYQTYKSETEGDIGSKESDIDTKEGLIADNDEELVTEKENLSTATAVKEGALKTLDILKKSCVDGEETYDERVKKREEEIAALKEALDILIAWQSKA